MPLSPVLARQTTYPFVRLDRAIARLEAQGTPIIDFGMGDPRGVPPKPVRDALAAALEMAQGYPRAHGLPELRDAITAWLARRFGVELEPMQIVPTLGSKEAIFTFPLVAVDRERRKDLVLVPEPGYPVYERGAVFAGAEVRHLPLLEENAFLPDLGAVDADTWERCAILWINYPNNPTGAVAPRAFIERAAGLAAEYDFLLAADEAYSELWFDGPPASALEAADTSRVVVFNTLSKRSSMTGYRSGFVAAGVEVADALRKFRPSLGTAPQDFVQHASVVAWNDEEHVDRIRGSYGRKRALLVEVLERKGYRLAGSVATMYLWVATAADETSEQLAERLLRAGIVVTPGSYLGASGEGYVRLALVPTEDECRRAVSLLEEVL